MKVNKVLLASWALMVMSLVAFADPVPERTPREQPVTVGKWHSDLEKARAYAEANGLPLVAVWSNARFCNHCVQFERSIDSAVFKNWMKDSGIVFYFGCVYDGQYDSNFGIGPSPDGKEGYHGTSFYWCRKKNGSNDPYAGKSWPYVRIYWPKGGVDEVRSGSEVDGEGSVYGFPCGATDEMLDQNPGRWPFVEKGDYKTYNPAGRYAVDYLTNKDYGLLRNFKSVPAYNGGEFGTLSSVAAPRACLEVEKGTSSKSLIVPLTRTNSAVRAFAATNYVISTFPSGKVKTNKVEWVVKQKLCEMSLDLAPAWLESASEKPSIKLELYDHAMVKKGTLRTAIVDAVENSAANPLWIGERTVDSLSWGEWTMDIDVATNKVASVDGSAYTLVLVGGSLWCPDCYALDEYLIETDEFKSWTSSKRVACVAIDVPRFKNDSDIPSLLSHTAYDSKTYGIISGSGWLARHSVPLIGNGGTNAQAVLERNLSYINNDTAHGGLCLPEPPGSSDRKTSGWKTGVPALLLLRADGTVAGRIYQFSNDGRNALKDIPPAVLVQRLDELLAQANTQGGDEEQNDSVYSTTARISGRNRAGIASTLSFVDQADYYRIEAPKGTDISFDLEASAYSNLVISVVNGSFTDPDGHPVVSGSNSQGEVKIRCILPSDDCYVKISYPLNDNGYPVDEYFALGKNGTTLCGYKLMSDSVFIAVETMSKKIDFNDGSEEVTVEIAEGQKYKFIGVDVTSAENLEFFEYDQAAQIWTAKKGGVVTVKLTVNDNKSEFALQKWNPGKVEFSLSGWSVKEKGDDSESNYEYEISLVRAGGLSGTARAVLSLAETSANEEIAASTYFWGGTRTFEWPEGSNDVKKAVVEIKGNEFADGNQKLVFKLLPAPVPGDAAVDGEFTLIIEDDDEPAAGRLQLSLADWKAIPASRRIVAVEKDILTLSVRRVGGVDGSVEATLDYEGAVKTTRSLSWNGREDGIVNAYVTVPPYEQDGLNRITIALSGLNGTEVDPMAKYLTVQIVPNLETKFAVGLVTSDAVRYVRFEPLEVDVIAPDGVGVSIDKISGSLAPGLNWEYRSDAKKFAISGVPSKAGTYAATYQISENGIGGSTLTVSITVTDPASPKNEDTPAVNPYLGSARTVHNVMVISNKCLIGLMNVTVPRSGRVSAKLRPLMGNAVSLMSASWAECDDGNYTAELDPVTEDAAAYGLRVTAAKNGEISVSLADSPAGIECIVPKGAWTKDNPAETWRGYYTVSMPIKNENKVLSSGDAYVTFRMTADTAVASGKMVYAGMLPDGQAFSGLSVLAKGTGEKEALLPVVWGGRDDRFSSIFLVDPSDAVGSDRAVWSYSECNTYWLYSRNGSGLYSTAELDVYGNFYDENRDITGCCTDTFGTQLLTFFADTGKLPRTDEFERGAAIAWNTNSGSASVWVREKNGKSKIQLYYSEDAKEEHDLTLNFNVASGIVTGSLRIDFGASSVIAKYRGVVLQGWGAGSGDCNEGCSEDYRVLRPFISGSAWFYDEFGVADKKLKVRRGIPISVGVNPGE